MSAIDSFLAESEARLRAITARMVKEAAAHRSALAKGADAVEHARNLAGRQNGVRAGHWAADPWAAFDARVALRAAEIASEREAAE